ncbi:hypothetical protein EGR_08310 [Echinococcus granulosus]|uniref:Uncharacterized protein n=1 Tax=Echinococcus granulosus TaxID=6210 RepID=W6U8R5_ECHGR|nr:hypothetical protein EGR_08310 [Echinococcus granulosus]EUB56841.1 hypothetical protein EGR_08310 [Echinococcus granulosus]
MKQSKDQKHDSAGSVTKCPTSLSRTSRLCCFLYCGKCSRRKLLITNSLAGFKPFSTKVSHTGGPTTFNNNHCISWTGSMKLLVEIKGMKPESMIPTCIYKKDLNHPQYDNGGDV